MYWNFMVIATHTQKNQNNTSMAEGETPQRSVKDSYSNASGDAEESFCDPCINSGKWVAVEGYCQICQEYLCGTCLGVHKNQKITRGHTILDKNQMPGGQAPNTKQDLCVEVCKTHNPEIVRFYCKAHDEPGCVDCMTLNHTSCKKDRIQDISDGFQATNEFKLIQQNLNEFHKAVEVMKDVLNDNLKNLDTTFDNIQHQITSFRTYINDYLDQIQKQITDEAVEMKKTYETETNRLIAKNESMKSELEDILQKIKNDTNINVNSIFVITKEAKQKLGKMERDITEIEQSQQQLQQQQNNRFSPSFEIEKLVLANTPLGKFVRTPNVNTTASYSGTFFVKSLTDKSNCCITDCTLLGPDRMVVTDGKIIKLIDLVNKKVKSSYETSAPSWGVTAISTDQVAVTLPGEGRIQLFNVASTFTKQHEIQVNKDCYAIAYKDGKFAVTFSNPGRVEILDKQGQVLHTVQGKEDVLQCPSFITFGQDKDTVVVAASRKVSVVTFKGHILHTYADCECISSFVITPGGVLFVCSWGRKRIYAVSSDFKICKTISTTLIEPTSILYCDINNTLYIIGTGSFNTTNTMEVYDLNV